MKRLVVLVFALVALAGVAKSKDGGGTGIGIQFGSPSNVALSLRFSNLAMGIGWSFSG
jgi:hypothetical protein